MNKLAIAAVLIAAGAGLGRAADLETSKISFNLDSIKLSDIQKAGPNGNMNGGHGGIPVPGQPHPGPWHPPFPPQPFPPQPYPPQPYPPQPGPWATQTLNFQSGQFSFNNEAQASMDEAVRQLNAAGYAVMESRLNWTQYTLVFSAPARAQIKQYTSGQYSFNNEAKAGMDQAVAALKQSGKIILEARLNWTAFTISYLDGIGGGHNEDWNTQKLTFQSGQFSFNNEAKDAMDEAVRQLTAAGYPILESRLNWTMYTIAFTAPARARIQSYTSGQYSFNNEAKAGMDQAVNSMKQSGKIVLEARLNWTAFTISYLEGAYRR
ncbi:MAG: hypothetical protein NTX59_12085 [Elusimicrobia bacterium]|nr:hypothetical protein [Elusimicrobiota bacterium]